MYSSCFKACFENVDDHLNNCRLVDMINQMKKKLDKFPSINPWKRRDSYHCHLLGNFEQDVVTQPENDAGNNLSVQPFSTQQVDNISNSQDRRLALNPLHSCMRGLETIA